MLKAQAAFSGISVDDLAKATNFTGKLMVRAGAYQLHIYRWRFISVVA
jgi:hypothetical protein